MNHSLTPSRRRMLQAAALLPLAEMASHATSHAAGADKELLQPATTRATTSPAADPWHGLKLGVASYSFRKISVDTTIAGIRRLSLRYVSIKDAHLALKSTKEQREALGKQFRDAGITPLSCGVISLTADEAVSRNAFEYARDLGAGVIVCHPLPDALPLLDKLVEEFDIKLAIHNHGPEAPFFKSPFDSWKAIQNHDPRIGVCIDVGHTGRAKADPVEAIMTCKSRLYDMHLKDITSPEEKNASAAEVELGRGVLDTRGILRALIDIQFTGHVGLEHEKNADSPLPGLAESVGYAKGVLL